MLSRHTKKAFTLTELVVVVIAIGILAGLAIPKYTTIVERQIASEGVQILSTIRAAQHRFALRNGGNFDLDASGNLTNLDITIPASQNFDSYLACRTTYIAQVRNIRLNYWLYMATDGTIDCCDGAGFDCARLGIATDVGACMACN
ncbi:MAG: prepilin-type N-terminal cleavage/methylation domain-containing protein [Candidatus Omnitrophota bacterium]